MFMYENSITPYVQKIHKCECGLNLNKTEVVLLKSSRKLTDVPLKLKLSEKRL